MTLLDFLALLGVLRTLLYVWYQSDLGKIPEWRADIEVLEDQTTWIGSFWHAIHCPYCAAHHLGTLAALVGVAYREPLSWWYLPLAIGYGWAAAEIVLIVDYFLPPDARILTGTDP